MKSIEMQVALPRTQDAGKLQEQLQQRGQLHHDMAAQTGKKEDEKKAKTVSKQEQKDRAQFHKEGRNDDHQQENKKRNKEKTKVSHPYKGTRMDFSG
ncbi:hypothetical protein [Bacillus dakarensis]|uniref:hypothetical protein n=1 Tax=Robertmurraya dakarensis TaxID=1926278 RepID=UPI001F2CC3D3|nr:hypothetical protein [Bacillus dakarensis]